MRFAKTFPATLVVLLGLIVASCSEKSRTDADPSTPKSISENESENESRNASGESEIGPEAETIGNDCIAFLTATKTIPPGKQNKDCPTCPATDEAVDVLSFQNLKVDHVSCAEATCEVIVQIHAKFNPSSGGKIYGGLVGWIPAAQRDEYAQGKTPSGLQIYKVKVIYTHSPGWWKAVEFNQEFSQ